MSDGLLNSRQEIEWTGAVPTENIRIGLPDLMDRLHFCMVQRSVLGAIRCHVTGDHVDCDLLNRWHALLFAQPETTYTERRVVRTWHIQGGLLARPDPPLFGRLQFGWEATGAHHAAHHRAWVAVEAYPSRMLRLPDQHRSLAWTLIGRMYAWYHARVTCRYLRRLALWIIQNAVTPPQEAERAQT